MGRKEPRVVDVVGVVGVVVLGGSIEGVCCCLARLGFREVKEERERVVALSGTAVWPGVAKLVVSSCCW